MEAGVIFKRNEFLKSVNKYWIPIAALSIVPLGKLLLKRGQYKILGFVHIWSSIKWKKDPVARDIMRISPFLS